MSEFLLAQSPNRCWDFSRVRTFRTIQKLHRLAVPRLAVLMLSLIIASTSTTSHATVDVEGDVTALRVTTSEDVISDVLAAISMAVNVRYRTSVPVDAKISGIYSGSAEMVITRLLEGYNFAIGHKGEVIEVSVFGKGLNATSTRNPSLGPIFASSPVVSAIPDVAPALGRAPAPISTRRRDDTRFEHFRLTPGAVPTPAPTPNVILDPTSAVTFAPVSSQVPAGTVPTFAPVALGPTVISFSRVPMGGSAQFLDPTEEEALSSDTGVVPKTKPGTQPSRSPSSHMAAVQPGSTPPPETAPDPAQALMFSPRRVQRSVSSRLRANEFSWMFPESSYSRSVRITQVRGVSRQRRPPNQPAADAARVPQSTTSPIEQSTPLERLVKTLSAGISKVLQP
jgi:hypothetical protein